MKDLLVLLGKRIHELRAAKKWSQEEFAHMSGLHRTYIGQIERGEKNISFANPAEGLRRAGRDDVRTAGGAGRQHLA